MAKKPLINFGFRYVKLVGHETLYRQDKMWQITFNDQQLAFANLNGEILRGPYLKVRAEGQSLF